MKASVYQNKLQELQAEQKSLLNSTDRRKKTVRIRIKEITSEFYAVKAEWRAFENNKNVL